MVQLKNTEIVSGPKDDRYVPKKAIGRFLYESLQNRNPNTIAAINANTKQERTSGQIFENAIKLTKIFKDLALKKDDIISVISENTITFSEPLLAGLWTGVIVNPMNPLFSIDEFRHALLIVKPKVIFCSTTPLETILMLKKEMNFIETIIVMDPDFEEQNNIKNYENLLQNASYVKYFEPEDFDGDKGAVVLLSSGTSGLPKCVLLTYECLRVSVGIALHPKFGNTTTKDSTVLLVTFYHVFGLLLQVSALASSMKLIVLKQFIPDLFLKAVADYKVNRLFLVPSVMMLLAKSPIVNNYNLSNVKHILWGSAPCSKEVIDQLEDRFDNITIQQGYSLTELGAGGIFQVPGFNRPGAVGVLAPNTCARVCNPETWEILGPMEHGEICLRGPTRMKEYLHNKAATDECIDSDGFYHTGDLGYYDHEGNFYIIDRIKEIIKYNGFQVPPAELEALILRNPAVKECGVIGIPNKLNGQLPYAFVVLQNGQVQTEKDIQDFVSERIVYYKHLYGGCRFVDAIPRNATGKILRRKLLEIYSSS